MTETTVPAGAGDTTPTQVAHPWKATARTVFATVLGVAPFVPEIISAVEGGNTGVLGPVGAGALVVSAAITRVMAVPIINGWLSKIGLGSNPKAELDGRHAAKD